MIKIKQQWHQFVSLDSEEMFLFEKSLTGASWNKLYDLRERHGPFYAMAELKQTAEVKILMSQILI